ncbi:Nesprin-1 Enaptin KASH domain-containing protein 1 [Takifugu flavidus]|uniref:Nesprin-1 Enaptin KASH domain-containing protein 1 n=1 Tax=Takifugu flavidus TaxID=433684 RepID=A0A5C6NQ36_9TELE|nr:Nesprin-1 Enaptin KASH domain-containing protein 1 [Takifugu flavidus]
MSVEETSEGEERLSLLCEEAKKLQLHLPKASVPQIQDHLSSCQREWENFLHSCSQNQRELNESIDLLKNLNGCVEDIRNWLHQTELSLRKEQSLGAESQQGASDAAEQLERLENLHKELLDKRRSIEGICQEAQSLSEGGRGSGEEVKVTSQLQLEHQALLKTARERLYICQESQALGETLQGFWSWLEEIQERLGTVDSTMGTKEQLEQRLETVQDILLLKGEGEVKLNMVMGKGELALRSYGATGQEVVRSQLQEVDDAWATLLVAAMSCHSRLEWTVSQWGSFLHSAAQLRCWMEAVGREVRTPLTPQPGPREKASQLERLRALLSDLEDHQVPLSSLEEKARELFKKTGDTSFNQGARSQLQVQFDNLTSMVEERVHLAQAVVLEHQQYLEAVKELTDWLMTAGEELQSWSDASGDSISVRKKLTEVRECVESRLLEGRERFSRVRKSAASTAEHTAAGGCEAIDRQLGALSQALEQWEGAALRARDGLEVALAAAETSEEEYKRLTVQLEDELKELEGRLKWWSQELIKAEGWSNGEEAVKGWQLAKDILEGLHSAEPMAEKLKGQLNNLVQFSRDVSPQSEKVTALIKQHNSLSLRASRECQNKERLLEQRFRAALRDFQQWLVNAKISTAKCFDVPQNVAEASNALQRIQEFLSDREHGQARLSTVRASGELLILVVSKDRVEGIKAKVTNAREDWKSLMNNLQMREDALKNLQSQMTEFEASAEPLQEWLNTTEVRVQESSVRLHDLPAKKQELNKLQCVLEEVASREAELGRLREKAHHLWEGQAAGKGFVHRVSQLSAQYLALSNLTKDKASRIERIVGEHQLFSQGLKELQDWLCEAQRVLNTCVSSTIDKSTLEDRMLQLEALLAARQEREIQLKMLLTRGEAVQRNTSAEGVPVIRKQIQDLKDSWDSLLSSCIRCKSQLEGALSRWTSYQEDVSQFVLWMDRVEETLSCSDRQFSEMRDKTANLGKTKLLYEEVLNHSSPLETIATKGSNMTEPCTTQQEVQQLQCRYNTLKDQAKNALSKAKGLVLVHQEYQRALHVFEEWLEQEQATLASISHPDGNVETLEKTLEQLQLLQDRCSNGQSLLSSVLTSREKVIPWGVPQIEDRALDTAQREWGAYQGHLEETHSHLSSTLGRLKQMGQRFLILAQWLEEMEKAANVRQNRRSDKLTKDTQLKKLQGCLEVVLSRQVEVDGLSSLTQEALEETCISSHISVTATQLIAQYHSLLLNIQGSIKQLQEELKSIEDADNICSTFTEWISSTQKGFAEVTDGSEPQDRVAIERMMKKLEALQSELQNGHGILKSLREQAEQAASFLTEAEAENLGCEVETRLAQLEELAGRLRQKHSFLQRMLLLAKEFQDRYKVQAQWLLETRALLSTPVEAKAELYQRRALLAKYKALSLMVQSHDGSIKSVIEKGDTLLASIHYSSVRDKTNRLKKHYSDLCNVAMSHVETLEDQVKEQEAYHKELQEMERWLLQMSSRMVTPDPTVCGSLESATQQLASHKAIMEEIAGFEDRLAGLKERGAHLVQGCGDRVQSKLRQQVQAHQQGIRDSYSAICSTAQRVYQSLDNELQRHVSLQDTLQQCQTWLSSIPEAGEPAAHPSLSLESALCQVKHERALQEQASTYLQLVCSTCDLSEARVRETAAAIQHVRLQIEERMLLCEELANNWRDIEEQKAELEVQLRETEQQLENLIRGPAELEPRIAQNLLDRAQEFLQQIREKQSEVTRLSEALGKLSDGKACLLMDEIRRLKRCWRDLSQRAEELEAQRGEDMQRSVEFQEAVVSVEELFHQVSREWDYLARADTESTSEHLEALKKLSSDLEGQRTTLEDLRDQKHAILPRLSLLDKELVKQQTLEDLARIQSKLKDACEGAKEHQPTVNSALKTSPPPDLAQSFLFEHLSACVELEARQQQLDHAISEAQSASSRLGLSEKRGLQELVDQAQTEVEALGADVAQRRKYLSKAFTERTQFIQGLAKALSWVQHQERKALIEDHIALLPEDLAKQVAACRFVQNSLCSYRRELASLWLQGRELVRDATDKEKAETQTRLGQLQAGFETALQRTSQRLTDLEKALTSRKYFQVDLDKICHWLKEADAITFPELNLSKTDDTSELQTELSNIHHVLEQASEYENLLLIVQRIGQEILPTLNEIDHCYLDERLNALPQQYNSILALAKEKKDRVQQIILEQKEFSTFFGVTRNALEELQEQFDNLEKQTITALQRASTGVELENQTDCVEDLEDVLAQETHFTAGLEEQRSLNPLLGDFMEVGVMSRLKEKLDAVQLRKAEIKQQLDVHRELLHSCATLWTSFQHKKERLVDQLVDIESKMAAVTTAKAVGLQHAEEKVQRCKSLVAHIDLLELPVNALKENASELEQIISESSKAITSHSVSSLWQRWTRLRSVAQAQERTLEDTLREWRTFTGKMEKVRSVSQDLNSRVPDSSVEKAATRAVLQNLLEYHDSFIMEVEREQSILALLFQQSRSLRSAEDAEAVMEETIEKKLEEKPFLQEIIGMQEQYDSLLLGVRSSRSQVQQELREREDVEKELGLVKGWIQDTRGLLLSPTADLESLLQELEVGYNAMYANTAHGEVISRRQSVERMMELQQSKYQDLQAALPSELSMQLAEVALALGSAEDQVQAREREVQQTRDVKEDFSSRLHEIETKLNSIALKLQAKGVNLEEAKEETKALCEECECCNRSLAELGASVQEFWEQNPLLCKQLGDAVTKLTELQVHTFQLVQDRANRLKKAEKELQEYQSMKAFILGWTEKAEVLVTSSIALLRECRGLHGDLEAMGEREEQLGEALQTESWEQQVKYLSRCTEELQQTARTRLQSLQDAAKDMLHLEAEVKNLHAAVEQIQVTLASPDLHRLSLREQLTQRQRLLVEMEGFKQKVVAVQQCQSALWLPEEVVTSLPICRTAQCLQQEASQLQHTTIQQCNILQEAVVQYEQYEQEVKNLQRLIEEAHRIIQDRPVSTSNIQELQAQIQHHEELAQKIRGYQEQIALLHSKCKMLTVKAKHATMLLTVSEVEGLSDGMEELSDEELPSARPTSQQLPAHPSVVMMTAGRCHTLLSPVTEESGEEGTNSEVSSPPACRSPSPGANADAPLNQGHSTISRAPIQELYDPSMKTSTANLDDLQRSWETLKNVISEKQKSLYEALERQQHYQESLQSISTKMESIEGTLNEGLEPNKSPESQMAAHQALMDEILMLQEEIGELQTWFSEELADSDGDGEAGDQLALQSTLTVLGERMATIRMKASGKRQLLEERISEQLEGQRQEQALQRYHSEAEELDHWLLSTRATLSSALKPLNEDLDMEEQLIDCQNMLLEIEQKVSYLSELSVHSESLLLEGRAETKGEAEQLTLKLRSLKDSLVELQQMLQDKQVDIQGSLQEQEDSEPDSSLSQSPNVQDWLSHARSTRTQQHHDNLLRQRELQHQVAEQRKLLQSVANFGEELLNNQTLNGDSEVSIPGGVLLDSETVCPADQLRQRWENLNKDQSTKLQLSLNSLEQDQLSPVLLWSRLSSPSLVFKGEPLGQDSLSPRALFETCSQTLQRITQEAVNDGSLVGSMRGTSVQQQLYSAVSAASSWLDAAENQLLSGPVLLSEHTETQLTNFECLNRQLKIMTREVNLCRDLMAGGAGRQCGRDEQVLMEDTLEGLQERMGLLESTLVQYCDSMKDRLQDHSHVQNELRVLFAALSEHKHQLLKKMAGTVDRPASKQLETLSEVEDSLKEFEQRVAELKTRADGLQSDHIANQELLKLQDAYEELVLMVGSRRSSLNHGLSLKAQYEAALHDLTNLVDTAQDKMAADQKMTVTSVKEVQMLLDKHKEFFQGLECHMILTQTFYSKVCGLVAQRESQVLEETMALAQSVLKQAHRRGVELEGIQESWSRLVENYQAVCRQLEAVECSIPTHLKTSLMEHQPQLYQVLEEGKRLLLSVGCVDLENQLTQLGEHWLSSTTKVNKELHRLDSTLKHWSRYQNESAELSHWLQSAVDQLEFWTAQSVTVPQELETVRDHLCAFLEFSKEVDAKSSLRSSVLNTGNQLLRLKRVDTAGLRSAMGQIDTQWAELLTHIPVVQEKLHQLQMEKLASRHAITELMSWISLMENIIEGDQDKIQAVLGSEKVQEFLQKYKGFRIDLTCKQLTVDFVNQSVLQMSSHDVEGKRSDKTDFAEKLGAMNRRWQILQGLIGEKIQHLEGLLESWMEHESGVQALKTWLTLQEEKLKKRNRIEDVASVQNALKDCHELEELVKEKEKDLEKAEERGNALIQKENGSACSVVRETLKGLKQSWARLDQMIIQKKGNLRLVLEQWTLYRRASEEINGYLMEGRYSVSRLRLLNGSLEAVQQQVESLEGLQEEMDKQESSLRKFGTVTHQLLTECHPSVAETLNRALHDVNIKWNHLLEQISEQLKIGKDLQGLWQRYKLLHSQCVAGVRRQEECADRLLKSATDREITEEESSAWMKDCSACLGGQASVQESLQHLQTLGDQLKCLVDASSSAAIQSDLLALTYHLAKLEHSLQRQQETLQSESQACEGFRKQLNVLIGQAEEAEEVLKQSDPVGSSEVALVQKKMEKLRVHLLKLSSLSPDLERINELVYRLPVSDSDVKRLQNLNRNWAAHTAHLNERFSKLQSVVLQQQSFLQKCETWMEFLTQTEQKLTAEISGNYQSLLEQQRDHELFQAEMFSRQQILYSIINDGHHILDQGSVDDRDDFSVKLALLSNEWQGVVRRAQQRRGIIDSLVRQWQNYQETTEKLQRWLQEVSRDPSVYQPGEPVALLQARNLLDEIQQRERVLHRQQGSYILTVEAGMSLLLSADAVSESSLQAELMEIQERWRHAHHRLDQQRRELQGLIKNWERCEKGINTSMEKLKVFKMKLSVPLPDNHEELHSEQIRCKELEGSAAGWTDDLASLFLLRDSLEGTVSTDDITVLQERLQLLQCQWGEVCHQLSLRRQQVSEKLNEWAVFNEKNKELCEWLTQMESMVSQNGDISIEEMMEKLRKDYQEEINVAQENKQQLQAMGERLARASQESKAAEIQQKLNKVSERWQHLLDLIAARVKKLRETLVAVQQLEKKMSSLRSWLSHIEMELSRPIVYDTCEEKEIEKKLNQQQVVQRDIEKHSTGVASVLNLCEVLLHDCDACSTETGCDSIQQSTRGLERRWRNICAMSMERRLKIEETWRLWQKFLDDYWRFEDWLKTSERKAALPNSSGVLYTVAKEELKKFEAFQRQVQECLTQLELINKQYRRLARENRTDSSCRLKDMVHNGNRRWDNLQKRVTAILRRLRHFISQREEFETARDSILVWLTEMDLQLTNIEHFSECDVQAKIKQLRAFQQEIVLNTAKIELALRQGEGLIEKSEPLDAAVIEEELEELQRYCQEVFGRVDRYYKKLRRLPLADDELDGSDRELDMEVGAELSELQWGNPSSPQPSSRPASSTTTFTCTDLAGRDTPASLDSIPLEWDHDYDLSRGLDSPGGRGLRERSKEQEEEEDEYLRTAAAVLSDVVIPESPEAYIKLTENTLKSSSGEPGQLEASLRQLDQALNAGRQHLQQREALASSSSPDMDSTYMGYMRLMGECRGSIDAVKRAEGELTEDEDDLPGLTNLNGTDAQGSGVIERWELIQAQSLSETHRHKQDLQQLSSDLQNMRAWLGRSEAELGQLRGLVHSADIHTIQQRIKKLKELLKGMDAQKSEVLSINLRSADFLQTEHESEEAWELREGLKEMNASWNRLGASLEDWREELQGVLMQCQEFHEMSHGLLLWLENIDRRRNEVVPIAPGLDRETLQAHHKTLTQVKHELLESQQKVSSLQELSAQLLVTTSPLAPLPQTQRSGQGRAQGSECLEAQEKVHVIMNRLKLLLKQVTSDLQGLETRLEAVDRQQECLWPRGKAEICHSTSPMSEPRGKSSQAHPGHPESVPRHSQSRSPGAAGCAFSRSDSPDVVLSSPTKAPSFLFRVLRAAFFIQLLLLLLIGLACMVPMTEEDYSCHYANNFARSFHPMLRYMNGPPPI